MEPMTIADIIKAAHDGRPVDAADAFNNVIQSKMAAAIDARRDELANSLYGSAEDNNETDDDIEDVEADDDNDYDLDNSDIEELEDEDI